MLSKLLDNPNGWDVSMLAQSEVACAKNPMREDTLIAELRSQIELLQTKVDNLNRELGEKDAFIKLMRKEGIESA